MSNFFHYPDQTFFAGGNKYASGLTFGDARTFNTISDKIEAIRERFNHFYLTGLVEMKHPFTIAINTCVGIEVLGQMILGFDSKGETIPAHTIEIYEMLGHQLRQPLSATFIASYNKNRTRTTDPLKSYTTTFTSYAHIVRKGLRNAFSHSYRSLGVMLSDSLNEMIFIDEDSGCLYINPYIFRQQFIEVTNRCFEQAILNEHGSYGEKIVDYFDLLVL